MDEQGATSEQGYAGGQGFADEQAPVDEQGVKSEPLLSAGSELTDVDLPEDLSKVLYYAFDEAARMLAADGRFDAFTLALVGDDLIMDTHPDDGEDDDGAACFESAARAVNTVAHLADSYVFCYDGYIETDGGDEDMVIAEVGRKGAGGAEAFGLVYRIDGGDLTLDEALISLGEVDNLFD